MSANRSWLAGCHDHRRLRTRAPSGRSATGSCGRTLNRRRAFTHRKLVHVRHRREEQSATEPDAGHDSVPGRAAPDRDGRRRWSVRSAGTATRLGRLSAWPDESELPTSARASLAAPTRRRAVVDERIRIKATVFREGHDAVAANVVWSGTTSDTDGPHRAPLIRMQPYSHRARPVGRLRRPGPDGRLDLHRRGLVGPAGDVEALRRGQGRTPARPPRRWPTTSRSAPCCWSRSRPGRSSPTAARSRPPSTRCATTPGRSPSGSGRRWRRSCGRCWRRTRSANW